jgi:hypothetical protein
MTHPLPLELTRWEIAPSNKRWMIYRIRGGIRQLEAWRSTEQQAKKWVQTLEARNAELCAHMLEEMKRG